MKKLLLVFLLLSGVSIYSQNYDTERKQLEIQLKKEFEKEYENQDVDLIKKLRAKISHIKEKKKTDYIDSTKTVIYDFKTKNYTKSNIIPIVGEPIVLKIENINRLAYDVSIKSSDVAIVDEYFNDEIKTAVKNTSGFPEKLPPIENKTIASPIVNKQEKRDNNKIQADKSQIEAFQKEIKVLNTKNDSLNTVIDGYQQKITQLRLAVPIDTISDEFTRNKTLIDNNKKLIKKNQIEIDKIENEIIQFKSTSEAVSLIFNKLNENYSDILKQYLKVKNIEIVYQNYKQLALNPILSYRIYNEKINTKDFIVNEIENFRKEIESFNIKIGFFNSNFYSSMNDHNNVLIQLEQSTRDYVRTKYQQIKDEVDKIKNNVDDLDLPTKLLSAEVIHTILSNKKTYEIVSAPIQPFEDYVTFEVEIKKRDSNKLAEYDDNRKFTYMEYTQGGVRFDFSTGVVFNFGGNNNKYQISTVKVLENNVTVDKKQIVLTDKNDFTPMLSAMFHTSFRRNGIWAFGLTLGASINVETFQLNSLFPGVSLLIGKKQKFIVTAGPAFRQVDVLKNNYQTEINYNSDEFNDTSELTSKQFKIGTFVGITYNLTQKQRGKFKINGNE